jgi:hypothetical protein
MAVFVMRSLIIIANHNHNTNAISLRNKFSSLLGSENVKSIDSGSQLTADERTQFDDCQENIFYSGLINRAFVHGGKLASETPVLFICSDVRVGNAVHFMGCLVQAFSDSRVMVWAPSCYGSGHPQMWPRDGGKLRQVSFAEGFCFATRKKILERLCPIDLSVNKFGWGIDKQISYIAALLGGRSVVDDGVEVFHSLQTGYDRQQARLEQKLWTKSLSMPARCFHRLALWPGLRTRPGYDILQIMTAGWERLTRSP